MSSNEPVLVKIFEVVERWVTVDVWVRDNTLQARKLITIIIQVQLQ